MKVVILGAGPAGLAAGWELAEAGISVEVIDKAPVVGGMSSSFERAGCILDYGTHGFHRSKLENQPIVDRMVELMGPDFIQLRRKAAIHFQGKYFNYPLRPKDIFFGLNPFTAAVCFVDFLGTRLGRRLGVSRPESNIEDWVKNRFGRRLYDIYFGPYTHKVWGVPPTQLTLKWAAQRIPSLSLWSVLKKALLGKAQADESDEHSHSPYREVFYYTEKGAKLMWDKVAERIEEHGGTIRLGAEATGINCDRDLVRSVSVNQGEVGSRAYCDWLVSTMPLTEMVEMLHPSPDVEVVKKVRRLKFRAMVLIYILARKEQASPYQWVYYSSSDIFFNRLSEYKNLTPAVVPPGKTILCLETSCFQGDDVWNASEDEVYLKCMDNLENLKLLKKTDVETHFVLRLPHAYPLADREYEENFPHITESLDRYRNLLSVGRQGSFAYLNMDQSMEDGFNAARRIIGRAAESRAPAETAASVRTKGENESGTSGR